MPNLTSRFDEAMAYARRAHDGQLRKGTTIPYVAHLLGVAALTIEAGGDEDQAIATLLHDVVEDQGGQPRLSDIRQRFGERVAEIVAECSDSDIEPKPPWRTRKEAYLEAMATKSTDALLVSLADKVYNAEAILADLAVIGDAVWDRFKGGREGTLWYYSELADRFELRVSSSNAARLRRAVNSLHAHADVPPRISQ